MSVKFKDNSVRVKNAIEDAAIAYLHEASGEVLSETQRNTGVNTGQLKGSWDYKVDDSKLESTIGSPLENAIWEEFGTGEFALKGNGRKGGWAYQDDKGHWHKTTGKPPRRALWKAFKSSKPALLKRAEEMLKGMK